MRRFPLSVLALFVATACSEPSVVAGTMAGGPRYWGACESEGPCDYLVVQPAGGPAAATVTVGQSTDEDPAARGVAVRPDGLFWNGAEVEEAPLYVLTPGGPRPVAVADHERSHLARDGLSRLPETPLWPRILEASDEP